MTTRVFILDSQELVREGSKAMLDAYSDLKVVGEASCPTELMERTQKLACDVIIMEIGFPRSNGLDALQKIVERSPSVRVIVFSVQPEHRYGLRALKAGAMGYLTKDVSAEDLAQAIRKVALGEYHVSAFLLGQLVHRIRQGQNNLPHELLSNREYEVFFRIARGLGTKQISEELSLSVNTITTYRSRIYKKLRLKSSAELVRYAYDHQLTD